MGKKLHPTFAKIIQDAIQHPVKIKGVTQEATWTHKPTGAMKN
jgi:hypothetical protein